VDDVSHPPSKGAYSLVIITASRYLVGLDRYQYSVSVSGRYQWYRFGIGIADTAADTRTDTSRLSCLGKTANAVRWLFAGSRKQSYINGGVGA